MTIFRFAANAENIGPPSSETIGARAISAPPNTNLRCRLPPRPVEALERLAEGVPHGLPSGFADCALLKLRLRAPEEREVGGVGVLAFGEQRFYAPAGLPYRGTAISSRGESNKEVYEVSLKNDAGFLVRKLYLPEL